MKKVWKKTTGILCAGVLSVIYLTGCGGSADDSNVPAKEQNKSTKQENKSTKQENKSTKKENEEADSQSNGFYGADLEGSVVEFSETGFSLSPATTEEVEGGYLMQQAAPGSERDEDIIQITYTDNAVFQIVNLSYSSLSEISREDTDKKSVKKQSSVCVFGSCQDIHHWTASKILILRWK